MGNDVSTNASDFATSNIQTQTFGCYNVDFSVFQVTASNQRFIKSTHLNASLACFGFRSDDAAIAKQCFNNALTLRSVRHPSIVKFLDVIQQPWLTGIITEPVSPLEDELLDLYPDEIVQGFHSICSAVTFLHTKAQVSHNSLSLHSLYATSQGQWKLGNFELCRPLREMSSEALDTVRQRLGDCAHQDDEAYKYSADRPDAHDLYCLGKLCLALCDAAAAQEQQPHPALEQLRKLSKNCLCAAAPGDRWPAEKLHRHAAFAGHAFTQLAACLADFALKGEDDLRQFYTGLRSRLFDLPEGLVARRLARLLLGRLPLTHPLAPSYLLPYLLRPYRGDSRGDCLLSEAAFKRELVPYLAMVLRIRDLPVRCALLDHFPAYCHLFDWDTDSAHRSLIPELLMGLRDRHDRLVARTHVAVAALLPLVGYPAMFGDKADAARRTLFTDAQPRRRLIGGGDSGGVVSGVGGGRGALKDLAVLSDSYRGPPEAAAASSAAAAAAVAIVEADAARIAAEKAAGRTQLEIPVLAAAGNNSRPTTEAEAARSDAAAAWGDVEDWDAEAEAEAEEEVEVTTPATRPQSQPPTTAGLGMTAEALTIRPVVTATGRQIDEFLAELEPSIVPRAATASAAPQPPLQQQQQRQQASSLSQRLRHTDDVEDPGGSDSGDGWSVGGDDDDDDLGLGAGDADGAGGGGSTAPPESERV